MSDVYVCMYKHESLKGSGACSAVGRTAGSNLLEGQLVNSRTPEIAIYIIHKSLFQARILCTHLHASFCRIS